MLPCNFTCQENFTIPTSNFEIEPLKIKIILKGAADGGLQTQLIIPDLALNLDISESNIRIFGYSEFLNENLQINFEIEVWFE